MSWQERFANKRTTAADAIGLIPRGHDVFISSGASEPEPLVQELVAQASRFENSVIVHLLTLGSAPYVEAGYEGNFRHKAFFIGPNVRHAVHEGRADYTPVFLSQIPDLIRARTMPVDVALIQCSPPNRAGYVNLGVSVDTVLAAVQSARLVIAQINPEMPVLFGSGFIPMESIDAWFVESRPLPEVPRSELDDVARQIGRNVATLVEDGSTLQMGIGQIPDAVLEELGEHRDLGVWTEMFSDGVLDLIEQGNITCRRCTTAPDRVISSFTFGTKRLYDYVDRNPLFELHPSDRVNNPVRISRQHKMVAINSALQIDLTGQVCADSIGGKFYSGIGGQVDFIRGASMCPGGKPIIALRSTAKKGTVSRIAPVLDEGAGVVTSRGDVHYVVTEHGIADLKGRSVRARALALAGIADPDFRAELLAAARARRYVPYRSADAASTAARFDRGAGALRAVPSSAGQLERAVECSEGRKALVRPLASSEIAAARAFVESLADDEPYQRWTSNTVEGLPDRVRLFDEGPSGNSLMLVAEHVAEGGPDIVGLGYYVIDHAVNEADIALIIAPDWRCEGLGTAVMRALADSALDQGVNALCAEILVDDAAQLRIAHSIGLPVHSIAAQGHIRLSIELPRRDRRTRESRVLPRRRRPGTSGVRWRKDAQGAGEPGQAHDASQGSWEPGKDR